MSALLEVEALTASLRSNGKTLTLVDNVSFSLDRNQTVGIVGESGSGKSTLGLSLMRLLEKRDQPTYTGKVLLNDRNLLALSEAEIRQVRGREISMVLQDPMASLNPVFTIGNQIREAISCHGYVPREEISRRVIQALQRVSIPAPESRVGTYPHQLSGGMRQRVVGGIAMACDPSLLIADEPTTSLDVTIQAQYLQLLQDIQQAMGLAVVLITHDFGVVAKMCDRVCVMYGGGIVEDAKVADIFDRPAHPYTQALMASRPSVHRKPERLAAIPGSPPRPDSLPPGCRFAPRCQYAQARCHQQQPSREKIASDHWVNCWYPLNVEQPETLHPETLSEATARGGNS